MAIVKMKIFQSIQNQFAILGINSQQQNLNPKIIVGAIFLGVCIVLQSAAIFEPTNEFKEYIDCVYMTSTTIIVSTIFVVLVFSMRILFEFIEMVEGLINESE